MQIENLENKILISPIQFNYDCSNEPSVIYICFQNNDNQYIGFYINKTLGSININSQITSQEIQINFGGIQSIDNYFILHSNDYNTYDTINIDDNINLTKYNDVINKIENYTEKDFLIFMGYSIWSKEDIENKIKHENWLCIDSNPAIIFNQNNNDKWNNALSISNIDPVVLSMQTVNA